jgi:ubiquinone biosynthesis protein
LDLERDIKDIKRFKEIIKVFFEEGLGDYVTHFKGHLPWKHRVNPKFHLSKNKRHAAALRRSFERLGPTFVKLGQLLSLRADLVPREFTEELSKLQDQVPSFSYAKVKKIVENEFGKPINVLFKSFDKKPYASASIAQVHKAILKNGDKVAVKVQRPNVHEIINEDLDILFFIAKHLEERFPIIRDYHPVDVIKEFAIWTRKELNFNIEARHAERIKEEMQDNPNIKIPKIYEDLTSHRVMTMEFINGVNLDDLEGLKKFKVNKKKIAENYFLAILEQALIYGLFHADPHPANIFVQRDGKIVFLDYGIVGEVSEKDRTIVMEFISSIPEKNADKSINLILKLAKSVNEEKLPLFKQHVHDILQEVYFHSVKQAGVGKGFYEIISTGAKYGIVFKPEHVLMAKAIYQAEAIVMELYPQFKLAKGLKDFERDYLKEQLSPIRIARKIKKQIVNNKELLLELPERVQNIIERLENPPEEHCEKEHLSEIEHRMQDINQQKNLGLAFIILFVATLFFFYAEGKTHLFGIAISTYLFIATFITVIYILIKKRKH